MIQQVFYTVIDPWGETLDLQCDTAEEAYNWFDNDWAERCADNGDKRSCVDIEVVGYIHDDEGEMVILSREWREVEYEYYHGDFAEHNTWW